MKVKFAGRVYDVTETRILPGGLVQYGIEDEPGHIDWISNVETVDDDKAAELMARMSEDVKDASLKVEDIVDRYVKTATPELRQQLIDKLTEMRKEKFGIVE